jgi:hypothetical protein
LQPPRRLPLLCIRQQRRARTPTILPLASCALHFRRESSAFRIESPANPGRDSSLHYSLLCCSSLRAWRGSSYVRPGRLDSRPLAETAGVTCCATCRTWRNEILSRRLDPFATAICAGRNQASMVPREMTTEKLKILSRVVLDPSASLLSRHRSSRPRKKSSASLENISLATCFLSIRLLLPTRSTGFSQPLQR